MSADTFQIAFKKPGIHDAARQVWDWIAPSRTIAFSGSLGAGKTTFIHAICDMLQVEDVVSSPTFALINEYHFHQGGKEEVIYHMDWYRLRDASEAVDAGMEDAMSGTGAYCFIEWPEKAPELLEGLPHVYISLSTTGNEDERQLTATRYQ